MTTVPVAPGDLTWLLMDRPNNLMYVHGLLWFAERPDWDKVREVLRERLVERFGVFARRAVEIDGTWVWEDDPEFDLDNHVRVVRLPDPGSLAEAQRYISSRFSDQFDHSRPLWEMDLIEGVNGLGGSGEGAMVLARFHHGIADGVRLVQVLLSLLDSLSDDAVPLAVGRSGGGGPFGAARRAAGKIAGGTTDFLRGAGTAITRAPGWVAAHGPEVIGEGINLLQEPTDLVDAVTSVASEDNALVNTWRSLGRLALSKHSVHTVWSGTPGVDKRVAWVSGIPLDEVRRIGKAHGATINDVLLGAVSLGVTEYLREKGERSVEQVNWLIPVSLKPIDAELPEELGNHFALVMMPMPLGTDDPETLLAEVRHRMTRIKNSAEPAVLYGIQRVIAETPAAVSVPLTNYVANKAAGILTNVPGPRGPMALAGTEVAGILGWVPSSGDQPLGLCIFSYNGLVNIGIAADARLVPDPDRLGELIEQAVEHLAAHT